MSSVGPCSSRSRSRTTSSSRPRDFATTAPIARPCGTTAPCTGSSPGRRFASPPRRVACASSPGATRPPREIGRLLGLPFDLDAFRAFAAHEPVLGGIVDAFPRLPADSQPGAVRGARHRDHDAADLAQGGGGDPRQPRRALRRPARRCVGVPDQRPYAGGPPTPPHRARVLGPEGGVRARARTRRPRPRWRSRRSPTTT